VIVIHQPDQLRTFLNEARSERQRVGLVPTLGALHGGHRSLIRRAVTECDVVAVTIFVNPLQFGPAEDFQSYPRDLSADTAQADEAGAHVVLAPPVEAMFPEEPLTRVSVRGLTEPLEGWRRPGHFDGVATIVTKLFAIAGPCCAYFGEKDYQQLLLVRRVVSDLSLPVVVVACPTVREPDGLALSSRNAYMNAEERAAAPVLYWSLLAGKRAIEEHGVTNPGDVRAAMLEAASHEKRLQLDYAEVADPEDLTVPNVVSGEVRLLVAGRIGRTRLIDNVAATPPDMGG
jgi:pantoate--beta-alanine ligase